MKSMDKPRNSRGMSHHSASASVEQVLRDRSIMRVREASAEIGAFETHHAYPAAPKALGSQQ